MMKGSDLFWYRARHWRFIAPFVGLIWAVTAFILYVVQNASDAGSVVFVGVMLLATISYLQLKSDPDQKPDERQRREIDMENTAFLGPIAALSMIGAFWFSLSDYFSMIWLPKTPEDWKAIMWLLFSIGAGSKMMHQRLRALPPLDEGEFEPV
jgi:hypothetical protein